MSRNSYGDGVDDSDADADAADADDADADADVAEDDDDDDDAELARPMMMMRKEQVPTFLVRHSDGHTNCELQECRGQAFLLNV